MWGKFNKQAVMLEPILLWVLGCVLIGAAMLPSQTRPNAKGRLVP